MGERKRRTKAELDPELLPTVLTVVKLGAGREAAAAQAGISAETLRSYERIGAEAWRRREEALLEEREPDLSKRDAMFAQFFEDLRKAESGTKSYLLGQIQKASSGDWRAGAWLLEKMYPREFGPKVDVNARLSGSVSTGPQDLSKLSDEELWQLRSIQKKLSEGKKNDDR